MLTESLIIVAVGILAELVVEGICRLIEQWGKPKLPQTAQTKLSDTDKEKAAETVQLIHACFGENVTERIHSASNRERIALVGDFAEQLAREYGLDIVVDVTVSDVRNCGGYNWKEKKAVFNIALLMMDVSGEQFDYCVRETLDTIVHELRHAVQHRAIETPGFWNVEKDRTTAWATNMAPGNYIKPEVNLKGYANQPIEKDAVTFAALVMEGVK